jgi:hypothetical protein
MRTTLALLALCTAAAADLPVTKVIVYKNGVAYFERAGDVKPGEPARLEFKSSEMDDVLKSLVIEDRSGGKVRALRYELNEPVTKRLAELPLSLQPQQAVALLLDQLKGARAEFRAGGQNVTGSIVSGRLAALPQQGQRQEVTLLLDSGELRILDLDSVTAIKLLDPALQRQLMEALSLHSQARSREKRVVLIEDEGAKRLTARYLVPAAVWKSAYRLIFPETGDPTLEGWAIVDNSSGEDWTNVDLTVVSGRPVSFVTRLYDPKYIERPKVELAENQAVRPTVYAGAMGAMADEAGGARRMAKAAAPQREMMLMAAAPAPAPAAAPSSVDVATETRETGELFEYRFSGPVTAKKGESAMIPFVQQPINARRLLVYSDRSSANPRSAAELSNNTGKTLDGGPLTVYQGGSYGGEALMETLKAGDKRLISFAVDLGTRVTTNFESGTEVIREVRASRGLLTTKSAIEKTTTYTIANVDAREKALLIEHPVNASMKVLRPKPDETTPNQYRFAVKLPAKGSAKLAVVEEDVVENTEAVSSFTPDSLFAVIQNRTQGAAGRKQLETIAARKRELADASATLQRTDAEINEIVKDQDRIRQNLNSLNRVSGQQDMIQRYVTQLSQGDAQLVQLRDRQAELRKRMAALQSEVNNLIEKLEF